MPHSKRAAVMFTAQTTPRFIEAYLNNAIIDVSAKQVVITMTFDDFPTGHSDAHTFISRDPAVIAFHQRVYRSIQQRHAAADAAIEQEGQEAA